MGRSYKAKTTRTIGKSGQDVRTNDDVKTRLCVGLAIAQLVLSGTPVYTQISRDGRSVRIKAFCLNEIVEGWFPLDEDIDKHMLEAVDEATTPEAAERWLEEVEAWLRARSDAEALSPSPIPEPGQVRGRKRKKAQESPPAAL